MFGYLFGLVDGYNVFAGESHGASYESPEFAGISAIHQITAEYSAGQIEQIGIVIYEYGVDSGIGHKDIKPGKAEVKCFGGQ